MYGIKLNESEDENIKKCLSTEPNSKIWKRLQAIHSRSQGITSEEIAKNLSVSLNTITDWVKIYLNGGIEKLVTLNYVGTTSKLDPYKEKIEKIIQTEKVPTLLSLQEKVQERFGVEIGETGLYKWCKKKLMLPLKRPE